VKPVQARTLLVSTGDLCELSALAACGLDAMAELDYEFLIEVLIEIEVRIDALIEGKS
jgi:hypothetical protein